MYDPDYNLIIVLEAKDLVNLVKFLLCFPEPRLLGRLYSRLF